MYLSIAASRVLRRACLKSKSPRAENACGSILLTQWMSLLPCLFHSSMFRYEKGKNAIAARPAIISVHVMGGQDVPPRVCWVFVILFPSNCVLFLFSTLLRNTLCKEVTSIKYFEKWPSFPVWHSWKDDDAKILKFWKFGKFWISQRTVLTIIKNFLYKIQKYSDSFLRVQQVKIDNIR